MPTSAEPLADLTAILLHVEARDPATLAQEVRRTVTAGGYGDFWLRIRALPTVGLLQVELFDAGGLPRIDPALVATLSGPDRKAAFVHYNKGAGQGLVHAFAAGVQTEGWLGAPEEFAGRFKVAVGKDYADVVAADDGTRMGIGVAASGTIAVVRGRPLTIPIGTPTMLHSFGFHDRGYEARDGAAAPGEGDRLALIAFDSEAMRSTWQTVSGAEIAARIRTLSDVAVGPLIAAREGVMAELAALGDETPEGAELRSVHAVELATLGETYFYAGGEATEYLDTRLLPMFALDPSDSALDDPEEVEALEEAGSVLAAMVEVLPYASPEGRMMEQLHDSEIRPLAPWARPNAEYVGTIFLLHGDRVREMLAALDDHQLAARVDQFYQAWWRARQGEPTGVAYENWRRAVDEKGSSDVQRFLTALHEWRTLLEVARKNNLDVGLVFYA